MDHSIYVQRYRANEIKVHINRNKAGFLYGSDGLMPKNLRLKQANLRTIAFGGLIVGIILFFFVKWYVAAAVIFASFLTFPIAQKSAVKGVLEASLQSAQVYNAAVENGVLRVSEN